MYVMFAPRSVWMSVSSRSVVSFYTFQEGITVFSRLHGLQKGNYDEHFYQRPQKSCWSSLKLQVDQRRWWCSTHVTKSICKQPYIDFWRGLVSFTYQIVLDRKSTRVFLDLPYSSRTSSAQRFYFYRKLFLIKFGRRRSGKGWWWSSFSSSIFFMFDPHFCWSREACPLLFTCYILKIILRKKFSSSDIVVIGDPSFLCKVFHLIKSCVKHFISFSFTWSEDHDSID